MLKKIAVAMLVGLVSVTSVAAQGMNGCYLYEKDDYRGARFVLWGPNSQVADFDTRRRWNDEISSAFVMGNCSAMLYEHSQFRGAAVLVTGHMHRLKNINSGFNDVVSSARCTCS